MTDYEKYIDEMIAEDFSRLEMIEMCMNEFSSAYPEFEYEEWRKIIKKRMTNGEDEPLDTEQQTPTKTINVVDKYNKAINKGQFLLRWDANGNGPIERWKVNYYDAWLSKYQDFKDRVKFVNSDFTSGMIEEDTYQTICNIEQQLDEWFNRKQEALLKNKISNRVAQATTVTHQSSIIAENHGQSWADYDDKRVAFMFKSGKSIKEIAEVLQRSERAIYYRLEFLQIITPDQNPHNKTTKPSAPAYSKEATPLDRYAFMLTHMNRSYRNGKKAPHKVILMLSVMSLFKNPVQRTRNKIDFTDDFIKIFNEYWKKYVKSSDWSMDAMTPWQYMHSEPFWTSSNFDGKICAIIDDELRRLLINTSSMVLLRTKLIELLTEK